MKECYGEEKVYETLTRLISRNGWWLPKMTDSTSSAAASIFVRIFSNVSTLLKCVTRTVFVIINNVYCIPTYVVWMMLLFPVKIYQPQVYWRIEGLFFHWLLAMVSMWTWTAGYDIIEQGRKRREESLKQLEKHLTESYIPRNRKWMVLFPEGGFLCKRRETSQKYAKKNNLPILENVTLPRVGAMQTIFDVLGPDTQDQQLNNRPNMTVAKPEISWVLDITIAYPQGKPLDLPTIITGSRPPCETVLFYRVFPSSVVPREPEQLSKWLYDRWVEKEALLEHFYKHGTFLNTNGSHRGGSKVHQDPLRFLVLHCFFIMSSYIHYSMLAYVLSCFW
ncbi:acyl-CoA:lysophosphatidylglycerol acyltransferase 1 isoform X2 [Ooceraea biroi]|uniref:acyl-CoA:lysophosphatidylglycerol acyltransferase 1 isoform X2 n=1 Tax=Ooceraea biroi TaxID=2015173 RepID=UPI0005BD2412|nr:acyl-CoA:lysophosphatidylglycerol acyltransferase 1 isoform X2 [Ooceraea biroi]